METSEESRQRLRERISVHGDINDPTTPRPLVTLEEFFEGNADYGSIGYNFYPQPAPSEFYAAFLKIRSRPDVADVRVQVNDQIESEDWPSTDTIWIITSAIPDEVQSWLEDRFKADDVIVGFPGFLALEPYIVPEGMQAIGIWYD